MIDNYIESTMNISGDLELISIPHYFTFLNLCEQFGHLQMILFFFFKIKLLSTLVLEPMVII